jgi:tetratricopeptide (TPR) repeat protein
MKKIISIPLQPNTNVVEISLEEAIKKLNNLIALQQVVNATHLAKNIISASPKSIEAYHLLYKILSYQQNYAELVEYSQKLITNEPNDSISYSMLSTGFRFLRKPEASLIAIEKAVQLAPLNILWRNDLGIMYKEQGKLIEAKNCFELCISQQSDFTPPYWYLSDITAQLKAEYTITLEEILLSENRVQQQDQKVYAAYALFKHYDTIKAYDKAFHYLSVGASIQRKKFNYNHQAELQEHKIIADVFNEGFFNERLKETNSSVSEVSVPGDSPIFICGLPRSGTTLVEQIVSSHTKVAAGDELYELAQATQNALQDIQPKKAFPHWADELSTNQWLDIGDKYLTLTKHINTSRYFTDKMPLNYKALGLIAQALPHAKIIYCNRPPMDLLLGAFKQILSSGNKYSYDLNELTDMIIAQHQLMQHWVKLMPNKIFTLNYKDLVNEQLQTTTALLSFLELDFQQTCLDFHTNNRVVHTVSNAQVRKPLFNSALNAWHKYKKQLMPYALKMEKAGLIVEY